jgi:hypothetical protein
MRKNFRRDEQVTSADIAIDYARRLVNAEARGPGDIEDAMHRLEARTGIGYWTYWGLWNRRRKVVDLDLLTRLRGAYLATCERQLSQLQHALAVEKARGGNDASEDLVDEAEAMVEKLRRAKKAQASAAP